jgi:hypothetical protein
MRRSSRSTGRSAQCRDAIDSADSAANDVTAASRRLVSCVEDGDYTNDCSSEFSRVRRAHSEYREGELRFRIAHRAAILLGDTADERAAVFRFVRGMYDSRSSLVHGVGSPFEAGGNNRRTCADNRRLAELIRQAILRLVTLLARGNRDREAMLRRIDESAYSEDRMQDLRRESDWERFLVENGIQ